MTVEIFLILLAFFASVTSLGTEAVKRLLDSLKVVYASNIVVLCVAVVVGCLGMVFYYAINDCDWTSFEVVCTVLMIVANWLSAMLGYDKIKQAVTQFKGK